MEQWDSREVVTGNLRVKVDPVFYYLAVGELLDSDARSLERATRGRTQVFCLTLVGVGELAWVPWCMNK